MKKIIFGIAMLCALTISSCCGNKKTVETETTETTVVEEVVDSVAVETVVEAEKVESEGV